MSRIRILNVVGARPNFMKIAPVMAASRRAGTIEPVLVHTGQHRGEAMSDAFFRDLGIPEPDVRLPAAGDTPRSHAVQTAEIMVGFERVVLEHRPDAVLVVGDVDSTLACGLVAAKLRIPLAHVEAGLRSGDRSMPEEINRVVTDALSDLLFCTEQAAVENLAREGVDTGRVFLVGNVMVDTLLDHRERAGASRVLETLGLTPRAYAVLTLHRPSNVDHRPVLAGILDALKRIQAELPVVTPLHPRLRTALARSGLDRRLAAMDRLMPIDPLGYTGLPEADGRRPHRADRFRRGPGGDDHPRGPLPDVAGEHRAARHDRGRDQPPGGDGSRTHRGRLPRGGVRAAAERTAAAVGRTERGPDHRGPGREAAAAERCPMKQIVQNVRNGEFGLKTVPDPRVRPGHLLVRTRASLISAGTERQMVGFARKSLLEKARARPDLVRKTIGKARRDGLAETARAVMTRLDEPLPLGYSAAGVTVEAGAGMEGRYRPGQRVAIAGAGLANHAELNVVPDNLVAPVPDGVADEEACYATLCAIALHGVRLTRPELGAWCAVIGVGLVGQLAAQLLALSGVRVLALDVDPARLELAGRLGAEKICDLNGGDPRAAAMAATDGLGCDAVVIAAATESSAPFETAAQVARDRAIVSLIGYTGTAFPYSEFMEKELTLKVSRSYGPGRYDPDYETRGMKYPPGFVRWTETENLKTSLDLMRPGRSPRLDPGALTTHRFEFDRARDAYAMILGGTDPHMGVVLRYEESERRAHRLHAAPAAGGGRTFAKRERCILGVIGAGVFARTMLLPALKEMPGCELHTVVTRAASRPSTASDDSALPTRPPTKTRSSATPTSTQSCWPRRTACTPARPSAPWTPASTSSSKSPWP